MLLAGGSRGMSPLPHPPSQPLSGPQPLSRFKIFVLTHPIPSLRARGLPYRARHETENARAPPSPRSLRPRTGAAPPPSYITPSTPPLVAPELASDADYYKRMLSFPQTQCSPLTPPPPFPLPPPPPPPPSHPLPPYAFGSLLLLLLLLLILLLLAPLSSPPTHFPVPYDLLPAAKKSLTHESIPC